MFGTCPTFFGTLPALFGACPASFGTCRTVFGWCRTWLADCRNRSAPDRELPKRRFTTVRQLPNAARLLPNTPGKCRTPFGHSRTVFGHSRTPFGCSRTDLPPPDRRCRQLPNGVRHVPNGARLEPNRVRPKPNKSGQEPNGAEQVPSGVRLTPNGSALLPGDVRRRTEPIHPNTDERPTLAGLPRRRDPTALPRSGRRLVRPQRPARSAAPFAVDAASALCEKNECRTESKPLTRSGPRGLIFRLESLTSKRRRSCRLRLLSLRSVSWRVCFNTETQRRKSSTQLSGTDEWSCTSKPPTLLLRSQTQVQLTLSRLSGPGFGNCSSAQ
jgi:hypothetical protein